MSGEIIWGDARVVLGAPWRESVDLVFTSPPYNVAVDYSDYVDSLPREEWEALCHEVLLGAWNLLRPGGRMVVNIQYGVGRSPVVLLGPTIERMLLGFPGALYRGPIIWHKEAASGSTWGSWLSPSNPVLRGEFEMLYVFSKDSWDRRDRSGPGDMASHEWLAASRDVWQGVSPARRQGHPAPFPTKLAQRVIQLYTWRGDHVLDPFAGSGSTGVAAEALGRVWTMVEISREYCEGMAHRIPQIGYESLPITEGGGGLGQ